MEGCGKKNKRKRGLYVVRNDIELHKEIVKYMKIDLMSKVDHEGGKHGQYTIPSGTPGCFKRFPGLINKIKRRFYSDYIPCKRRRRTKKKGSGVKVGAAADKYITNAILEDRCDEKFPKRCSMYAKKALIFWRERGHQLQAAQLPVIMKKNKCITQGDYFTVKKNAVGLLELWMWELKTGWPPGASGRKQKKFTRPLDEVNCSPFNIWQLQRQFTHWAYEEELGIKIHASRILHIYKHEDKGMIAIERAPPKWCKLLKKDLIYPSIK